MNDKTSSEPTITKSDLEDPNLGKLNSEITWLKRKIGEMQGAAGEFFFRKPFKADKIRLRTADIPETDEEVLSLGAAKKLFGAASVRKALSARDENGTIIRGLPRDAFEAAVPPGPITSILMDPVDYTDSTKARLTGTATVPELFRGFNGCEVHIVIDPTGTPSEPIAIGHQYHDPENTTGPYAFEMKPPRPGADETWRIFFASRNEDIAAPLVIAAGPGQTPYVDVAITANPGAFTPADLGYPTIGAILEEGMLAPGDIPYVRLTIPYTAPSSGEFIGFTVWWSTDDISYSEQAFEVHLGGADGLGGTVYRNWPKPASNETWYIVLSPHSETFGHQLRVGPGGINKGSVLVEAAGPPSATGITDAAVVSVTYLTEIDDYGNPTFACQIRWTNPSNDSNFFHSQLTVQLVDSFGNGEPVTLLGDERIVGEGAGPGVAVIRDEGPWGPVGLDVYDRFRLRLYCVNRLGAKTLQTIAWGGNSAYDIVTSTQIGWPTLNSLVQQGVLKWDLPYVSVTFNWTAASSGSVTAMTVFRRVDGGKYEAIANLDVPNGADGLSYSHDLWLEKPVSAAETWDFVLSPHTSWDGHRLWIAPGNINYGSIVVQSVGPPADFGASVAAAITSLDINLAALDAYVFPTFAVQISWTHPIADSNFYHSKLTVQLVDAAGNPAPGMLGDERLAGGNAGPGVTITEHHGPWGPAGHPTYNRFRLRLYFVNRLGDETLQATAWSGAAYYDINTSGAAGGLGAGVIKDATSFKLKLATTNPSNLVYHNPDFEDGIDGWVQVADSANEHDTTIYYGTKGSLKINKRVSGTFEGAASDHLVSCRPGEKFYIEGWVRSSVGASGTIKLQVNYLDADKVSFSAATSSTITETTTWTKLSVAFTATSAAYLQVLFITEITTGNWYVDSVRFRQVIEDDAELADGVITTLKLANDAVTSIKILDLAITQGKLAASAVITDKLDTGAVTNAKLAALAVDAAKLDTGAVTETKIAALAVGAAAIQSAAIGSVHIGTGVIQTAHIGALQVTDAEIAALAANKITAGTLVAGVVYAGNIVASQVTSGNFTGCTMTLTNGGLTTNLNNAVYRGSLAAFHSVDGSGYDSVIRAGFITTGNASYVQLAALFATSGYGRMELANSSGILKVALGASGSPYVSVTDGTFMVNGIAVVGTRKTGWGAPTGTATRSSFATSTVTLEQLAQRVKALVDDLTTHGLIGA